MNLEAQIQLITVPQDFTRLCNAVLEAEHGDDFLVIDDDQADRGNDGYLKSKKSLIAMHCFKRVQNQALEAEIRKKMIGDLGKAIALKEEGIWNIDSWIFISNYPISESVARRVVQRGQTDGVEVAWRGPDFLAGALQRHPELRERFPALQANEISERLRELSKSVDATKGIEPAVIGKRVPRTLQEKEALLLARPDGWEYLLFGSELFLGKESLESKWHDHEIPPHRRYREITDVPEAADYLSNEFKQIVGLVEALERIFTREVQEQAFGPPGVEGSGSRIEHLADRVISTYEGILDWAAQLRQIHPPEILAPVFEIATRMADRPLHEFREFVDNAVSQLDQIPAVLSGGDRQEPVVIELDLHLALDQEVMAEYHRRMKRARRKQRWGF